MTPNERLYLHASTFTGVREIPGAKNNPEIMQMFADSGHKWVNSELTPWCSAAMNSWCRALSMPSTGSLRARSWLGVQPNGRYNVVEINRIDDMRIGDLLILWRESRSSAKGHITLFSSAHANRLQAFGGNQRNKVQGSAYPQYRFLAGRRFVEVD